MAIVSFLFRPFRARTWRELAYLLTGSLTATVAFGVVLAGSIAGALLAVLIIGLPVLLAIAFVFRLVADLERRRAALVYADPVAGVYRVSSGTLMRRVRVVWSDPQTWRDLLWLILLSPIGFGFGVAAASLWGSALYLLSLPLWWWAVPHAALPDFGDEWTVDTWGRVGLVTAGGAVAVFLVPWICAGLARAEGGLARGLLGPTARARLRTRVDELSTTRAAAADAQATELRRIERNLHDGAQARLVAVSMDLGRAREKLASDPDAARELVETAHEETKTAIAELRELVSGVHPAILSDRGLDAAISSIAARCPVPVAVDVDIAHALPPAVEVAAYFVIAEALANIGKHSGAASADVRVRCREGMLTIAVTDDGRGGADVNGGTGIAGLRDRVGALDGRLRLASPDGGPTTLVAEIPCAS
jgi:signal transduction histidine kinase